MAIEDVLSSQLIVEWDDSLSSLVIIHPNKNLRRPLIQIRAETLAEMSFDQASQFIGERLVLLIRALRDRYVDPTTGAVQGHEDV